MIYEWEGLQDPEPWEDAFYGRYLAQLLQVWHHVLGDCSPV